MPQLNLDTSNTGCFETYLSQISDRTGQILPAAIALDQQIAFEERLRNLTNQLDEFLGSEEKSRAYLVLGKVQSGKTSHLLGTLAHASTSSFALASIFTGVNNALNDQGLGRVQSDLSEQCIRVFSVPTSSTSRAFNSLFDEVSELIEMRLNPTLNRLGLSRPLPVLVTMKNPKRVSALSSLIEKLAEKFEKKLSYLMIDDEADQASQNAKAQKQEMAATYEAISELRNREIRHVMLSYTATPQAVLLAERNGNLRPDRCVTVPPRFGYFGLNELVEEGFQDNLIQVDDVLLGSAGNPSAWRKTPDSLQTALIDFYLCALIRHFYPEDFYSGSSLPYNQLEGVDKSTQMMIHQSMNVREHSAIYDHVKKVRLQLCRAVLSALDAGKGVNHIEDRWANLLVKKPRELQNLPPTLSEIHYKKLHETISSTQMKIVNGDRSNETANVDMPVSKPSWESHETWILIGGEILGRGLTIPQLTTTYFLRTAKVSNFDTISQQMRFCGYRVPYSHLVTLHAPSDTLEKFKYMRAIESTVWRYASRWDANQTDISKNIPPILYAAPLAANLGPTRKNVRDPLLFDQKVDKKGNILKSLTGVFNPSDVYTNLKSLQSWAITSGVKLDEDPNTSWISMESIAPASFRGLLSSWVSGDDVRGPLRAMAELFSPEMEELGLAEIPIAIFVKKSLMSQRVFQNPEAIFHSAEAIERAVKLPPVIRSTDEWVAGFRYEGNSYVWPELQSPHVGTTQRGIFESLKYTSSALIIEPVLGHAHKDTSTKLGFGLALTLFKPKEYEIQMMGHA